MMAARSFSAQLLLLAAAILLLAQLCSAHGDPPRLRDLVKKNPRGALLCPSGETLDTSDNDAAQNPGCVPCGAALQYACDGRRCKHGLRVLDNKGARQPICVPDDKFKIRTDRRTARGRNADKGGGATVGVTRDVGCGMLGWACCPDNVCELGGFCNGSTCVNNSH